MVGHCSRMNAVVRTLTFAWVLGLAVVTLAHPSATRMLTCPWAGVVAALWVLPVVALITLVVRQPVLHCQGWLIGAGLGLLALAAVSSAALSPFAAASLPLTWPTLGGVTLSLLLHHWLTGADGGGKPRRERLATAMAVIGAAIATASLVAWLRDGAPSPWATRNTFPFGHSTYTGGFIVMIFPWLLQRAGAGRRFARAAWLALAVPALLALAGTGSRGAVAGLGVMAGLGGLLALRSPTWTRRQKLFLVVTGLVLALGAIAANPRLRELALRRTWGESARESNQQRSAMIAAGWHLGVERPLLGWGPGSVPLAYPTVRARLDGGVDNVLQLHNAPIQIWATLGATGVMALALLIAGVGVALRRVLTDPTPSTTALAAAASLAGYGAFALTDHQFDLPIIAAGAAANLALLTSAVPERDWQPAPGLRAATLAGAVFLVAAPGLALLGDLRARRAYDHALAAWDTRQDAEALSALDRATALTPRDPYFQHQAAAHLLRMRDAEPTSGQRADLTRDAMDRLNVSLAGGVHAEYAHFNLGWLELEIDSPAAAARHFTAAARLVPDKGGVYFGLGLALKEAGRSDAAIRAFALEWLNDPNQLTSPAWEVPALAVLRAAVQAELLRLYAGLRDAHPGAAPAEAWTRWWLGERIAPGQLGPGFTSDSAAFALAQPALQARAALSGPAVHPWQHLYAAWREAGAPGVFTRLTAGDAPLAAALARRAARHRESFQDFLQAPTGDEPALMRTSRRERPGYGVLARHPDGPVLADVYVVQENRVPADYARRLFPPKGWLPGRFLLALLPPDPR